MKEITGELWDYYGKRGYVVCITTNGTVKKDGAAVMGRGCAKEATQRFPGIDKQLGERLQRCGNNCHALLNPDKKIVTQTFPTKHNWWEPSDLDLIRRSAIQLGGLASMAVNLIFILPRPGCGNGQRTWAEVKPLLEDLPDNVWVISREG